MDSCEWVSSRIEGVTTKNGFVWVSEWVVESKVLQPQSQLLKEEGKIYTVSYGKVPVKRRI